MPDWTVAVDSALLQSQTHCTLCGVRLGAGRGTYTILEVGWRTLCTLRCDGCGQRPGSEAHLRTLLQARYHEEGET